MAFVFYSGRLDHSLLLQVYKVERGKQKLAVRSLVCDLSDVAAEETIEDRGAIELEKVVGFFFGWKLLEGEKGAWIVKALAPACLTFRYCLWRWSAALKISFGVFCVFFVNA